MRASGPRSVPRTEAPGNPGRGTQRRWSAGTHPDKQKPGANHHHDDQGHPQTRAPGLALGLLGTFELLHVRGALGHVCHEPVSLRGRQVRRHPLDGLRRHEAARRILAVLQHPGFLFLIRSELLEHRRKPRDVRHQRTRNADLREQLPHGRWATWIEHHLPFTASTAKRAIRLHHLRVQEPQRFALLAPIGVAKAYVFLTLPEEVAETLLSAPQPVPSIGKDKLVAAMTFAQMMEVISALGDEQDLDGGELLVRDYRRKVHALVRAIDKLVEGHEAVAAADTEDELGELYDDLQDASARLAAAFALEP